MTNFPSSCEQVPCNRDVPSPILGYGFAALRPLPRPFPGRRGPAAPALALASCLAVLLALTLLCGCAATRLPVPGVRPFNFASDTFAYANGLVKEYGYDTNGVWSSHRREPKPDYTLHCFVVARSARQFFDNARFDPQLPVADDKTYRRLIRRVVSSSASRPLPETEKIVIPGYADLHTFSAAHEKLLKAECGSAWQSYFQRGNWRMIFPFSRQQQEETARRLLAHLRESGPVLVHVFCFPKLSVNHALLIFDATETATEIQFRIYDPNDPSAPGTLTFDRADRCFVLPSNPYFYGGKVHAYEIYWKWNY